MTDSADQVDSNSQRDLTASELSRLTATAFHEAGHSVMALSLGRTVGKISIEPSKPQYGTARLGTCLVDKERYKASKTWLEDEVMILLAGMVAESFVTEKYCQQGAAQDLRSARRLMETRIKTQRQLERLEKRMLRLTEHQLAESAEREAIEAIAKELLEKRTISGRAARHHYRQAKQRHA